MGGRFWGRSWRPIVGLAAVLAACLAGPASAELKYTTTYKDHLVQGTTPVAVWQYMIHNPINDPDDGPALANITHAHKLTFTTAMDQGRLQGYQARFQLELRDYAAEGGRPGEDEPGHRRHVAGVPCQGKVA